MWRYNIALFIVVLVGCHTFAQNVSFTAVAESNKIGVKDQVHVQYTVSGAVNLQTITNPSSPDFSIIGGPYQQSSTSVNIQGNHMVQSQSISFTYVLMPKHEGTFTIPPMEAKDAAGHMYQSNALTIQVVPGTLVQRQPQRRQGRSPFGQDDDIAAMMQQIQQMQQQQLQQFQQRRGAPQQQQQQQQPEEDPKVSDDEIKKDLFIRVAVDKSKVHTGEQITASYKLYSRLPMQMSISKLPSLNGFWTQDFDIPRQIKPTEEVLDGKKYQVFLLKKSALFPQETGELELDPAEAKGVVRVIQQVRRRMSDMFGGGTLWMNDPFFNNSYYSAQAYKDVEETIKSVPVKITVTPLPEKDKPENFGGAVGQFAVTSKIDKTDLTTDDVATLTLNITGSGNLKIIEAPKLNLPNGLNTYDPQIVDTITGRSTTISGSKIISYVIAPHTPGDYDIPSVAFSYFNPQTGKYVTEHTQPVKLQVKPGKNFRQAASSGNAIAMKDIHDIVKQPVAHLQLNSRPMLFTAPYWSMYAFPMLAFIGLVTWRRREDELSRDTVSLRRRRANKVALQRLVTARKLLEQQQKVPFYEEISKAIWLYLSDKLSIPLSALSRESAAEALNARKVPEALQRGVENVVGECETALYASGGSRQMTNTYEEAIKVISDLEDVFKA